ncbi:MAG TPA: ABC transporter substrate-binding protein [Micromonosporaceae bacterium]|nr:ABC transporter substrate-binding protein [Micromonosporaceae bacterium]
MSTAVRRGTGRVVMAAVAAVALAGLGACGGDGAKAGSGDAAGDAAPVTLRLGHFPNLTHATPIVGVEKGFIAKEKLGKNVTLEVKTFSAGPQAVEALFSGAIDATYIGPNPTVNAFSQSKGKAVKVIAGAASGGVALVVKPTITSPADLKGKKIATPQLGNTQDVAARYWLKKQGLSTTKEGGGDVAILPQENASAVDAFASGAIDGAWVPEPFASRLVKAGGKVLLDERDLWPDRKFVITNLLVSTEFLSKNREVVKQLVAGSVAANEWINANPTEAQKSLSDGLAKLTGKPLDLALTAEAWKSLTFLDDPLPATLRDGAKHAEEIGLLKPVDLNGLYDLSLLNEVLKDKGKPEIKA